MNSETLLPHDRGRLIRREKTAIVVQGFQVIGGDILDLRVRHRYCHSLSVDGRPLYYVAVVGVKKGPIPQALIKIDQL